jgi:DNA segregation ATPase FtsK/SpoIIIE, S-DNA-T family
MKTKTKREFRQPPGKKSKKRPRITADIVGLLLLFFAIFLFLSLITYNSQDPSWASSSTDPQKIHNIAGRAGASTAEAMIQFFGLLSFIIPIALIYLGVLSVLTDRTNRVLIKAGSLCFFLIVFSALFSLLFKSISWREAEFSGGGFIGDLFSAFLTNYFNHTGSILILLTALALFFVFTTHLTLGKIFHFLSDLFSFLFKEVRLRITNYRKEKSRRLMRERVKEKYTHSSEPDLQKQKEKGKKEKKKKDKEPALTEPEPSYSPKSTQPPEYLFPELGKKGDYTFPPFNLLDPGQEAEKIDKDELFRKKTTIEDKLREFKVEGEVREYHPGPLITTYEFFPYPGIKVSQVANLSEDLSLALGAVSVRIQRIPGKSSLGVEVPNNRKEIIKIRDIIQSEKYLNSPSKLTFALGKTIHGEVYVTDLSVMPHLLIAGATGSGKSVALNSLIASILYKASPDEVKLILIDPKRLEFSVYDGIPHLMCPVVKDPRKAEAILLDCINKMDERYQILGHLKVRNIEQYNKQVNLLMSEQKDQLTDEEKERLKPLPYIVVIIDELAELMMIGAQEIEYCIARLAQLARAVGIHLVMATQRPSTDVITGTIKNNFSCRIAFRVPAKVDSRIIIDTSGAEKLIGQGDMLFLPPNYPRLLRLHCAYISLPEITRLTKFVKDQQQPDYDEDIIKVLKKPTGHVEPKDEQKDPLFEKAVELVLVTGQASASYLQRKLKLGYARAARIIDQMEQEGIVGSSEGSKPREILVDPETYLK